MQSTAQARANHQGPVMDVISECTSEQGHILAHLSGGRHTLIGRPIRLIVTYSFDAQRQQLRISATLSGIAMGCATLSTDTPSTELSLSLTTVKASIALLFETNEQVLSHRSKVSHYAPFSWRCANHSGPIAHF